ncbi:hypothetical protein CHELA1G2_12356 [Hyphomicrobiales bacterium]|nr:hypothetical protein CHELA1G2_12356 [Hyphomicrobiales bacterium]
MAPGRSMTAPMTGATPPASPRKPPPPRRGPMPRTVRTMLLAAALPILAAGCKTTGTVATENVCAQWRGISWATSDTPETIDGVKGNNARRLAWCEGK